MEVISGVFLLIKRKRGKSLPSFAEYLNGKTSRNNFFSKLVNIQGDLDFTGKINLTTEMKFQTFKILLILSLNFFVFP